MNAVIFSDDNTSLSHNDNCQNNFLVLGGGVTYGIASFGSKQKQFSINFSKARTKFSQVYMIVVIIVTNFLMEKKSLSFKPILKMSTFRLNFV